jgi:hypothetical protein
MEVAFPHSLLKSAASLSPSPSVDSANNTVTPQAAQLNGDEAPPAAPIESDPQSSLPSQPLLSSNMEGESLFALTSSASVTSFQHSWPSPETSFSAAETSTQSLQPFSTAFPDTSLSLLCTASAVQDPYTFPDNFTLPAFSFAAQDPGSVPGPVDQSAPSVGTGSAAVTAALAALLGTDKPPPTHPAAAFFHRLTCSECGINVHLGCHCESGGLNVLESEAMKGTDEKLGHVIVHRGVVCPFYLFLHSFTHRSPSLFCLTRRCLEMRLLRR